MDVSPKPTGASLWVPTLHDCYLPPSTLSSLGSSLVPLAWVGLVIPPPSLSGSTESHQQILTFPRPQFFRYSAGNPLRQHGCFLWSSSFSVSSVCNRGRKKLYIYPSTHPHYQGNHISEQLLGSCQNPSPGSRTEASVRPQKS